MIHLARCAYAEAVIGQSGGHHSGGVALGLGDGGRIEEGLAVRRVPGANLGRAESDEQIAMEALVGGELTIEVERLDEPAQGVGGSGLGEGLVPGLPGVGERPS